MSVARHPDRLVAVPRLTDDDHVRRGIHQQPETAAQQGLVIGN
jgi:hypothetical protein